MEAGSENARIIAKINRRIVPFLFACFCVNFLDRVNIGFAALEMNKDIHITPEMYGLAGGIFFAGYTILEIPSNLLLAKVGARVWLARILITWGLAASACAFINGEISLYILRALLGVAEAGFFPGIIYYLVRWYPAKDRASVVAMIMVGSPISVVFGAPISTALLSVHWFNFAGWQWLFILEGIPAVILGFVGFFWLTERPEEAVWLTSEERDWLVRTIASETHERDRQSARLGKMWDVFTHGPTLLLGIAKLTALLAFFGITLWMPQIIREFGNLTNVETGALTAIPYIASAIVSVYVGRRSDRTGERTYHIAVPAFVGAGGFLLSSATDNPYLGLLGLCIAASGCWCASTIFWTLPASLLTTATAATGIALINTIGNLGGLVGPTITGWVRGMTGSFSSALIVLAASLTIAGVIVIFVGRGISPRSLGRPEPRQIPSLEDPGGKSRFVTEPRA